MSVCVSSAGGLAAIGPGSSSGMSLPHHHHHLLLQPISALNHQSIGSSAMMALPPHLFHPNDHHGPPPVPVPMAPLSTPVPPPPLPPINGLLGGHSSLTGVPLGTMDSQCASDLQQPPSLPPLPQSLATTNPTDDQFPNPDMLLALIARNKGLEGE